MADASQFFCSRLISKPLPIHKAIACIRIDCEIANLKRGEVLEEMAALGRGNPVIKEPGFNDDPRAGNLVPLNRDSEPGIFRSPSAHAYQKVRPAIVAELRIETC